ncbi:hypothetical protein [Allohahella marinimesophila]|uniref:Uncharacterized protein n=1 Tax=Allohahella marinimesophila TaxID=1054972 RepID=A0ABP7NYU2_9GAMM
MLAGAMMVGPLLASANDTCLDAARTELERAYCRVVKGGEGAGLPSFEDFRRNDVLVQALLLKRPAERLGLTLPGRSSTPSVPPGSVTAPPPMPALPKPPPLAPASASMSSTSRATSPATSPAANAGMDECRLTGQGDVITCANSRYVLAANKQNSALVRGVLEDANRLDLPSYRGPRSDNDAVIRYLSDVYAIYVQKMLGIGLGAATLSFTEFHHAFHTTESAGVDFARRSEETFQLLKADRKTMAVQTRLHDKLPDSIDACMDISSEIIVCDDVGTNWVFIRSPNEIR